MHTAIVIGAGLALLAACVLLGHAWGGVPGLLVGAKIFLPLWLLAAFVNMWVGVTKAGYGVGDEFPIFLLIFGIPMLVAVILKWRML